MAIYAGHLGTERRHDGGPIEVLCLMDAEARANIDRAAQTIRAITFSCTAMRQAGAASMRGTWSSSTAACLRSSGETEGGRHGSGSRHTSFAISRSLNFWTLPVLVFGSSAKTT